MDILLGWKMPRVSRCSGRRANHENALSLSEWVAPRRGRLGPPAQLRRLPQRDISPLRHLKLRRQISYTWPFPTHTIAQGEIMRRPKTKDWRALENAHQPSGKHVIVSG